MDEKALNPSQSPPPAAHSSLIAADELIESLRAADSPAKAITAGIEAAKALLVRRGFADDSAAAWGWGLDPDFGLPAGWSTSQADAEGVALAVEQFELRLEPVVITIRDAATFLAIPVVPAELATDKTRAVAMIAVELTGDEVPDEECRRAAKGAAGIIAIKLENSAQTNASERALQFAKAASRVQRALVRPCLLADALRSAIAELAKCDALIGGQAVDPAGSEAVLAEFGDLDAPLLIAEWTQDPGLEAEAQAAARVEFEIVIDGIVEAKIVLQSRHPLDEVEFDTLNGITTAIVGATVRFRADTTIENLRRSATRQLVEAQERERSVVAADIHDGVLQQLGATAIRLELAQSRFDQQDFVTAKSIIADGASEIRACARELRSLLMELRPQVLDDNGLNAALVELGRHTEGVNVEVTSDVPEDLESQFAITVFRIVQEALTNIEKHAQATTARVNVALESDRITIDISDDGVGYEGAVSGPSAEGSHLGLLGMRERAQMFGGTFSIAGASGGGTEIRATLPLLGGRDRSD